MTFLGQTAWCDQCKTAGTIIAAPGSPNKKRLYDQQQGRQQALGGDQVLCQCERHPCIIPVYGRKWKIIDNGSAESSESSQLASPTTTAVTTAYDDRFILRDTDGCVLTRTAYALCRATGAVEYGETDGQGHTHLLSSVARAENINLYIGK